jgi:ArsR family transcriptional regulator
MTTATLDPDLAYTTVPTNTGDAMAGRAEEAATLLRALSHGGRLLILCHLSTGEKTVGEIEALLGLRQAAVSQQLARLRQEGLVQARRDGKSIRYRLADPRVARLIDELYAIFCTP